MLHSLRSSAFVVGIINGVISPFLKVGTTMTISCSKTIQAGPEGEGFCRTEREREPVFHVDKVAAPQGQTLTRSSFAQRFD